VVLELHAFLTDRIQLIEEENARCVPAGMLENFMQAPLAQALRTAGFLEFKTCAVAGHSSIPRPIVQSLTCTS
jgi:hypothetical protein